MFYVVSYHQFKINQPNLKIIIHCQSKIATVSYTHISLRERYQIYGIKRA